MTESKINIIRFLYRKIQFVYHTTELASKTWTEITFDIYMLQYKTKNVVNIVPIYSDTPPYYIKKICDEEVIITKIKRIHVWDLRRFVDKQDAVVLEIYPPFARLFFGLQASWAGFIVPSLVNQVLCIDRPIDEAIKLNTRELKKVHKYSYELSNDINMLKFFYEKMYVHHIKKKYGDSAVEKFNNMEKIFKNGELVFVTLNGVYISAYLNEMSEDTYHCRQNGVLDDSFVKEGALVAAYYFSISRAKEMCAKKVDFGKSLPFLLGGVLRHKNQWGTIIRNDSKRDRVIYLKNVLFEQPFIYIDNGKLKAAVFSENDKLIKEYAGSGLEFNVINK